MSDAGSQPPPPPPPPNLAPPPGYAGYTPNLVDAVRLRRINGLRTAMLVLLGAYVIGAAITIATTPSVLDAADERRAGTISSDEFFSRIGPSGIAGALSAGVTLAIVVLTIIWLYRIVSNHRAIGRRTTWGPGWAIGGWFVPPLVAYVVPMLVLRESWKAADPTVPPGDDQWRQRPDNPVIWVWWVLYGLAPIAFIIAGVAFGTAGFGQNADELADSLRDNAGWTVAQGFVGILGAVAWALVVRNLSARHTELSGESRTR